MIGTAFPRLRLRDPSEALLALPWELPLASWSPREVTIRELPVGPSRHLVRFVEAGGVLYALKEEPLDVARAEYGVLLHLENEGLPAVRAVGVAEHAQTGTGVLLTEFLRHSLQYRRLLMRVPLEPGGYRDRLLDTMAYLLVDLHRAGVVWGDCSLANTLFRRAGDTFAAHLVDAETSEVHPELSDGQRAYDLDILVENVAFGLADLAAYQGRPEAMDEQIDAAEAVRTRYARLWDELFRPLEIQAGDRYAIQARVRRLNELGFAVGEIELEPGAEGRVRLHAVVTRRDFHARELQRRTGLAALEGQARLLLNDLREYRAWLEYFEGRSVSSAEGARRWQTEVLEPTLARLVPAVGPGRDVLQAYCDLLEHKWLLSERDRKDVGLATALAAYLAAGAPAPESRGAGESLDLDPEPEIEVPPNPISPA